MAITGTGTEGDPYIVHTMAEFVEYAPKSVYIKIANDIDVSKEYERISDVAVDAQIDLDGHAIKNILTSGTLFLTKNWGKIYNGKVINVYCERNTNVFHGLKQSYPSPSHYLTFENVAISVNVDSMAGGGGTYGGMSSYCKFKNCHIKIECTYGFYVPIAFQSGSATDSCIEINYLNEDNNSFFNDFTLKDCALIGSISGNNSGGNYTQFTMNGGYFDIDTHGVSSPELVRILGTPMVNLDNCPNAILDSSVKLRNTNQIRNPSYNNSNGFPVEEVI